MARSLKTFGKRTADAPPLASLGPEPTALVAGTRKLPRPPGAHRRADGQSRLAREDLGRACERMDELEYALDGLASSSAAAVLQRSALDLVAICSA